MEEKSDEKVAFVVPYKFTPPANGGHKAAYGFAQYVAQKVPFLCISSDNNNTDNLPFSLFGIFKDRISKYLNPNVAWRIRKIFQKENIRHLILFQPFMGIILAPIAWLNRINWGIYIQNIEYQRFRSMGKVWWPLMYLLEKYLYKWSHFLIFISPDDLTEAKKVFKLPGKKCTVVPYGTNLKKAPESSNEIKKELAIRHNFDGEDFLILFFGPQSYQPNLEAVLRIINRINPILKEKADFKYQLLICGGGLPQKFNSIKTMQDQGIQYLGFVEDIETYIKGVDLVLNPINTGGGVKTKIIEAIALNKTVVSSKTGAIGMNSIACQEKLIQVPNEDYTAWAEAIINQQKSNQIITPASFYETYYWANAISSVFKFINSKP